jgi:hypothetical protein
VRVIEQREPQPIAVECFGLGALGSLPPLLCVLQMLLGYLEEGSRIESIGSGLITPLGDIGGQCGLFFEQNNGAIEVGPQSFVAIAVWLGS